MRDTIRCGRKCIMISYGSLVRLCSHMYIAMPFGRAIVLADFQYLVAGSTISQHVWGNDRRDVWTFISVGPSAAQRNAIVRPNERLFWPPNDI